MVYRPNTSIQTTPEQQPARLIFDFISYIDRPGKTAESYLTNLKQFCAWLNFSEIRQPTRDDIIRYRDFLLSAHDAIQYDRQPPGWKYRTDGDGRRIVTSCRPGTAAQYLRTVKQFFAWTAAAGFYPDIAQNIHTPKVKADAFKKEALTAEEVQTIEKTMLSDALIDSAGDQNHTRDKISGSQSGPEIQKRLYAMFVLAVNAGLRTVELSRAKVGDLEIRNGRAYLYVWGKGRSEADQRKPLAPEVYETIMDYLQTRSAPATPGSPLFTATGNRSGGKPIAARTIGTMLKAALRRAGYDSDRITAHSLRHTAGTSVMKLTGNLYDTQVYMRHESPLTTEIYLHGDTEQRETEIAQQLFNYYHGQP